MKRTAALAFVILSAAATCLGQTIPVETDPFWSSGPANNSYSVAAADFDMDGDLDLIFANFGGFNTIYFNDSGSIRSVPWATSNNEQSTTVAAGDLNGDGYPDVVFGNYQEPYLIYINSGGSLPEYPTYSMGSRDDTYQVALCDIDGDGDLDLASAIYGNRNKVYLNEGGVFADIPFWESPFARRSTCVEAGDIDGDGFLDLVFGNFGEANTIFRGYGDSISVLPVWQSDSTKITWEISLGDVNGDGLLDLLCANKGELILAQENYLYLNEGGMLATSPAWSSSQTYNSSGAELADIDGDGDLDAVIGNTDQSNTIYLNESGALSADPAWYSTPANRTYVSTLIDVESDGDLDIAFANTGDYPDGEKNTLYRNVTEPLNTEGAWMSAAALPVRSIEYFDVDNDGDLDLAMGVNGQPNILYINDNGTLRDSPSWSSSLSSSTFSLTSGDIDGDGDLDLVCGNLDEPDRLYLNDGGILRTDPSWSSSDSKATWSVTLADFDHDRDLDLACGHLNQSNAVYANTGSTFETSPYWQSSEENGTWAVTSGDINGDGMPDLVCGNAGFSGESNTVYLSRGRSFDLWANWRSSPQNRTWSLALGDIDGDGDLDLACGNIDNHNNVYLNIDGELSTEPTWSTASQNATRAVAFEDFDGDGDLDLACGNYMQPDVVYPNIEGQFSDSPAWISPAPDATCDISTRDFDQDGDPDFTVGLYGEPSKAYGGRAGPPFRGDPLAPVGQRPQNSAFMKRAEINKIGENLYTVEFDLVDVESDPVYVRAEYRYRGETESHPVDISGQPTPVGPLLSSPGGTRHSFEWDVELLPIDGGGLNSPVGAREMTLLLTVIELPSLVSKMSHMPVYRLEAGIIEPVRPVITVTSDSFQFPRVTVGDTVSTMLPIGNQGNAPLIITSISHPSPDVRFHRSVPDTIPAFNLDLWEISLETGPESEVHGPIVIESNDPATPTVFVEVYAPITPLKISSRLLKPEGQNEVEPDEALTVIVTPDLFVRVEMGTLSYRITGEIDWTVLPLSRSQDDFIAIIPGGDVTEAGLEYFIEVRNDPAVSTDPEGAPGDSLFTVSVIPPDWLNAVALENSSEGYMAGREIRVQASLQPGTVVTDGSVHFRKGGDTDYIEIPIDLQLDPPSALIPDTIVTAAGVEYWLEVNTLTRTLTSPPANPSGEPEELRVTVPSLSEESAWPAEKYRIFSVPLGFSEDFTGTIEALLSDQPEFGPYDPVQWRSFSYLASTSGYVELSASSGGHFRPHPGKAFWLVCRSRSRIDTAPVTGYSTPISLPYRITLAPGWNMVGHPYSFPVEWDSISVDTMTMDEAEMNLVEPPIYYSGSGYRHDTAVLEPFDGYWINNLSDSAVTLSIPASRYTAPPAMHFASETGWTLRVGITAMCNGIIDTDGRIGIHEDASEGFDRMDRSCPPPAPGEGILVYFPQEDGRRLHSDIRGSLVNLEESALSTQLGIVSGEIWEFDISRVYPGNEAIDEIALGFDVNEAGDDDQEIFLIDRNLGTITDLRLTDTYTFFSGNRGFASHPLQARFVIIAGTDEYIENADELPETPGSTALVGNYPNPFNPLTVIRFDLAETSVVTIRIFDVRGAHVRTLVQERKAPGRYEIPWDGRTETGLMATSGIFFYLMETDRGFRQTRKLVLLR